jgi:putative ABC transport system permease protein
VFRAARVSTCRTPANEDPEETMVSRTVEQLRQSIRRLAREPGFTMHAVLILALGIGATAAVFSLIQGALLKPPPYAAPERLVLVRARSAENLPTMLRDAWSADQWEEWRGAVPSLESIAAYTWTFNFLVLEDGSESEEGMLVSPEYFQVTGLKPVLGRAFGEADAAGTATPGILLGYDLWQRRFDGDPDIVGKTVRLSRMPERTVIGVMPPDVRFLPVPGVAAEPNYDVNAKVDFWMPIPRNAPAAQRAFQRWNIIARLRDGATLSDAQTELAVVTARQAQAAPAFAGIAASVEPLATTLNAAGERLLLPLLAAAALVLLISCSNAAALLLVRGLQRRHEYGIRSAMGAGRVALFRHVISESLLLALLGGALGVGLAFAAVQAFKSIAGSAIPRLDAVAVGWPIVAFGLGSALLACLVAGLFPSWLASRLDPVHALRDMASKSTAGPGQRQVLGGVLVLQMALTLALLVGAGLLTRTMYNLSTVQSGFETRNVVAMTVTPVDGNWFDFHERALERVAALPGVAKAAFAWGTPLTGNSWASTVEIDGYTPPGGTDRSVPLNIRAVTPGYFSLLGQTIEEGRDVRSTDRTPPPDPTRPNGGIDFSKLSLVAVVNRAFVDRYEGGGAAVGKQLFQLAGPNRIPMQIVGIVSNTRTQELARSPEPEVYVSLFQQQAFSKDLVIRTTVPPETIVGAVERELRAIQPTVAIERVKTLDAIRDDSLASRTFAMRLLVGFAIVAIVLTLAGTYSVLSLSVAARRRELAIRTAVGANAWKLIGLVLRGGLRLIGIGIVAGIAASFVLSRVLQAMLFEVGPADPVTLLAAAAVFALVALLACWLPAVRAARIAPSEALKAE